MNDGVITGIDNFTCPCCGGLFFHFINIGDNSDKKIYNPEIFKLSPINHYPIHVKIDWQQNSSPACGPGIKIARYQYQLL